MIFRLLAVLMGLAAAGLIGVALVTYRDWREEPEYDSSQFEGA